MPQQIQVPGVGPVEFPDGMNNEEMGAAIERNFAPQLKAARNPEDVTAGMALSGVPVVGQLIPKAEAAIRAAVNPGEATGATWRERYNQILPEREAQYAQAEQQSPVTSTALKVGGGAAALGPVGATGAGARALGMAGSIPFRMGAGAASGAALSAADAAVGGRDIAGEAKMGGAIGAVTPAVAGALGRIVTPVAGIDPERTAAVRTLRRYGVEPSAGQITGSRPLQWTEQNFGEIGGVNPSAQLEEQLTRVPLKGAGSSATRATQENVDEAFKNWGAQRDALASQTTLVPDKALGNKLQATISEYERHVNPNQRSPAIRAYEEELANAFAVNKGELPGDVFQSLNSRIKADMRSTRDPDLRRAYGGLSRALDDGMESSLERIDSPLLGAWRKSNNEYRNLLVLEKAANASSTTAATAGREPGQISPAALYNAVKEIGGARSMARGSGQYERFARAASDITRGLPSSGTAQRLYYMGIPAAVGGLTGLYGGGGEGENESRGGSVAGRAAMGMLAAPVAGRVINSPVMQRYLKNRVLSDVGRRAFGGGVAGGLLSLEESRSRR